MPRIRDLKGNPIEDEPERPIARTPVDEPDGTVIPRLQMEQPEAGRTFRTDAHGWDLGELKPKVPLPDDIETGLQELEEQVETMLASAKKAQKCCAALRERCATDYEKLSKVDAVLGALKGVTG
jgi:hypothetical protein